MHLLFLDKRKEVEINVQGKERFDEPCPGGHVVDAEAGAYNIAIRITGLQYLIFSNICPHGKVEEIDKAETEARVEVFEQVAATEADIETEVVGKILVKTAYLLPVGAADSVVLVKVGC